MVGRKVSMLVLCYVDRSCFLSGLCVDRWQVKICRKEGTVNHVARELPAHADPEATVRESIHFL